LNPTEAAELPYVSWSKHIVTKLRPDASEASAIWTVFFRAELEYWAMPKYVTTVINAAVKAGSEGNAEETSAAIRALSAALGLVMLAVGR
jgi:hypothetical protein